MATLALVTLALMLLVIRNNATGLHLSYDTGTGVSGIRNTVAGWSGLVALV